ncbi:MAG: signal peptidase II [Bdellovibrionales bacterium GWB1_55_8]|nr:MAG: signal peptidase II [Bdellovibrionales bacterium GWB1_55_8]
MIQTTLRQLGARKYLILTVITLVIIGLDQWTKQLVVGSFRLGESISIIPGLFNLTYVRNPGAAFGLLAQSHPAFRIPFFIIVPIVALGAIGYIFRKLPTDDIRLSSALSLVMGGAIGNLIDRALFGYVIDFLDFHWRYAYHFPAFNVADSAICVGVGILMLDLFFHNHSPEQPTTKPITKKDSGADAPATR